MGLLLPLLSRSLVRRSLMASSSTMYAPTRSFTSTLLLSQPPKRPSTLPPSTPPPSMTTPPPAPTSSPESKPSSVSLDPESLSTPAAPPPLTPSPAEGAEGGALPTPSSFDIPPNPSPPSAMKVNLTSLDLDMTAIPPPTNPDGSDLKEDPMVKPPPNLFSQRWFQIAAPIWVVLGAVAIAMGDTDEEERQKLGLKPEDPEPSAFTRFKFRTSRLFSWAKSEITEPIWTELLPGKIPPERPYTLLVDLEGILTCSKWDSAHGWRTAKRPGADYFIAYLSQFYEIVLFTTQPAMNAAPIAEKLDPYAAYMPYRLYRDATRFEPLATAEHGPNAVIKDLAYLNRPLETVIMLDTDKVHASKQKGNALIMPKWNGEENDGGLVALIPFLESIGIYQPKDVRPVLLAYEDKDVAAEYAKVETARRDIEYRNWAQTPAGRRALSSYHPSPPSSSLPSTSANPTTPSPSKSSSWSSSLTGLFSAPSTYSPSQPSSSANEPPKPPPSYLDQKRAQAQMMYGEEQKYWAQNKDEIERLQAEDRERQMEEFGKSPLGSVVNAPSNAVGWVKGLIPFGGGGAGEEGKEGEGAKVEVAK